MVHEKSELWAIRLSHSFTKEDLATTSPRLVLRVCVASVYISRDMSAGDGPADVNVIVK